MSERLGSFGQILVTTFNCKSNHASHFLGEDVSHHQTLLFIDRDLENSLQARIASEEAKLGYSQIFSSPVVYLENHNPVTEVDAEII
jgi:hypothetical protein